MDDYKLDNSYQFWYHDIDNNDWSESSYHNIHELNTLEDYFKIKNSIKNYNAGIFFLMKDNIFPRWEDISNIDGGAWSFSVSKKKANHLWNLLMAYFIGNTLTNRIEDINDITGISFSPKINNTIIKIWNRDSRYSNVNIINKTILRELGEAKYRKHE